VRLQRLRGVTIGKNVFIGTDVLLDPAFPHLITIEDHASLAGRISVIAHSDPPLPLRNGNLVKTKIAPILIQSGAWITVGVIILPGVTIGTNSVVAAGSVVTKDVPPFTMVSGIPARIIKTFKTNDEQ
jgi:acetyltransferase-like isoleucine patch superfamily enzyme